MVTLVADGSLCRVELGAAGSRLEAATEHHEHIRCERCGAIAGIPGCAVSNAIPEVERLTGFAVTGHDLLFHGVCPTCAEKQRCAA